MADGDNRSSAVPPAVDGATSARQPSFTVRADTKARDAAGTAPPFWTTGRRSGFVQCGAPGQARHGLGGFSEPCPIQLCRGAAHRWACIRATGRGWRWGARARPLQKACYLRATCSDHAITTAAFVDGVVLAVRHARRWADLHVRCICRGRDGRVDAPEQCGRGMRHRASTALPCCSCRKRRSDAIS